MTLVVNSVGDNVQQPGIYAETYVPDQLIAGNLKLVTDSVTYLSGASVIPRGTLVGRITASGKFIASVSGASDGSQNPIGFAADAVDVTGGDATGPVYLMGEFNQNAITYDSSWGGSLAVAVAAIKLKLPVGLFLKTADVAADPS